MPGRRAWRLTTSISAPAEPAARVRNPMRPGKRVTRWPALLWTITFTILAAILLNHIATGCLPSRTMECSERRRGRENADADERVSNESPGAKRHEAGEGTGA